MDDKGHPTHAIILATAPAKGQPSPDGRREVILSLFAIPMYCLDAPPPSSRLLATCAPALPEKPARLFWIGVGLLLCFLVHGAAVAQVSQRAMPPSVRAGLAEVDATVAVPAAAQKMADEERRPFADGSIPLPHRLGEAVPMAMDLLQQAAWTPLPEGGAVARLRLDAPGATAQHLVFDDFWMPPGAQLFVYNEARRFVRGAFTHENNKPNGGFAIDYVPGETLILEYFQPDLVRQPARLHLETVIRGTAQAAAHDPWSDAWKTTDATSSYTPTSLPCSVNTACEEAAPWADAARASVMVVRSNGAACSGVLLNNTAQDGKAYILTAHHCGDPVVGETYENWVVRFHYASSSCEDPAEMPVPYTSTGVHVRAASDYSDFALLELMEPISNDADVYWAGWTRSAEPPTTSVAIGHPASDIQKIAFSNAPSTEGGIANWRTRFDVGCIEGGSSGSPQFDGDTGRVTAFVRSAYSLSSQCDGPGGDDNQAFISNRHLAYLWDADGGGVTIADYLDPLDTDPESLDGLAIEPPPPPAEEKIWINEVNAVAAKRKEFVELAGTAGATFEDLNLDIYSCAQGSVALEKTIALPSVGFEDDNAGVGFFVVAGSRVQDENVDMYMSGKRVLDDTQGLLVLRDAAGAEVSDYQYGPTDAACLSTRTTRSEADQNNAATFGFVEEAPPAEEALGTNLLLATIGGPNTTMGMQAALVEAEPVLWADEAGESAMRAAGSLHLAPAAPNPFNPTTTFAVEVTQAQALDVAVYNLLGQRVALLHQGPLSAGSHRFRFDAARLPSGVYLIQATGAGVQVRQTVTLVK